MAQLNVRFPDAFYKQVQRVVHDQLEMDLSSLVREFFIDVILIYKGAELPLIEKALAAIGQKHRLKGAPALVLTMCDHWREVEEPLDQPEELAKKVVDKLFPRGMEWRMKAPPREGKGEKEALVGGVTMPLKGKGKSLPLGKTLKN